MRRLLLRQRELFPINQQIVTRAAWDATWRWRPHYPVTQDITSRRRTTSCHRLTNAILSRYIGSFHLYRATLCYSAHLGSGVDSSDTWWMGM